MERHSFLFSKMNGVKYYSDAAFKVIYTQKQIENEHEIRYEERENDILCYIIF